MDDRVAPSSSRVNDHRAGHLVTYLGTAPGVGKTFRMLRDGRTRAEAGDDVVVGWVERHGRAATREQAQRLEIVPPRAVAHRGTRFEDLDVTAVIDRHPDVVLVDELAHTGVDGRARYQDVQDLLNAGIDVMTTVNVANLLSVRDLASRITGAGALEGVPDDVVRAGDVVLVDLAPDALRRRVADGLVYSADGVGGALANYFRPSNLQLLDTLARSWLAGGVDETFAFLDREAPARQKVIAGVSSSIRGQAVIERAAVLAGEDDAELEVVHVELQDGLGRQPERLEHYREMAQSVGARYREVYGVNAADTLGDLARSERARRVVVGARRSRLTNLVRGSVASRIRRRAPGIDVDEVAA